MHPLSPYADPNTFFKLVKEINAREKRKNLQAIYKSENVINVLMKNDYLPIQLLLFHYLGFNSLLQEVSNINKAKLLKVIFKMEGTENIRKGLSKVSEYKTIENLQFIRTLFEELGLNENLKEVKKDLAKAEKKNIK